MKAIPSSSGDWYVYLEGYIFFCLAVLALACLCTGCEVAESFVANQADSLGRQHSTDPDAQAQWDHDARYNGYGSSPSKR